MTDNARKTGAAVDAHFQFLMWHVGPDCPVDKLVKDAQIIDDLELGR